MLASRELVPQYADTLLLTGQARLRRGGLFRGAHFRTKNLTFSCTFSSMSPKEVHEKSADILLQTYLNE